MRKTKIKIDPEALRAAAKLFGAALDRAVERGKEDRDQMAAMIGSGQRQPEKREAS